MKLLLRYTALAALFLTISQPVMAIGSGEVVVRTQKGEFPFTVEIADTLAEQQEGLMHRTRLAEDSGMLFLFAESWDIAMWMKDTPLPLDMLFLDEEGQIVRIEENAQPNSERIIHAGAPANAVLELPGGTARRIGAKAGDLLISERLEND